MSDATIRSANDAVRGTARGTRIWLLRERALPLGERLRDGLDATLMRPWEMNRVAPTQREPFRAAFADADRWVLVMATGIAVRLLDGLPRSKLSDPAVVVVDEAARFAVSLLSGHEGGANALAYDVARLTGAVPVVTTATEALKPLAVGIGCRRGASIAQIEGAVMHALGERRLDEVREIATIDLKADEPGIVTFCQQHGLPLRVFSHAQIAARPWTSTPSAWVRENIGLDGVCEPCALLACARGALVVNKTALDGVAVAIAEDLPDWMHRV
ncbi:MAG TPA: cobalamin biosynthesis protein [Pararobbsia sp.]|nr:cobalamin biosynthesis protein [Pararobbsia sp.]